MLTSRIASMRGCARCAHWATRPRNSLWLRDPRRWQSSISVLERRTAPPDLPPTESRPHQPRPKPRFPKYLPTSPNAVLALRVKGRSSALSWHHWNLFRSTAGSQSLRLPVVTLQALIRKDEEQIQTSLGECLGDEQAWRAQLSSLSFKGVTQDDIRHWSWILGAEDGDARIARFVSTPTPKPIFLLFQLLRKDETLRQGPSITSVLNYVARHHVRTQHLEADMQLPFGAVRRSLDPKINMTPHHFVMLLRLLVHHCLRVWPSAITSIARLASSYIEAIPAQGSRRKSSYAQRCFVFNHALQLFQNTSPSSPVSQMRYNWRAQKTLLSMSISSQRPLIIDRASYRAMRRVMIGLKKSAGEAKVASRLAKTWPPYRQEWDGLDERRRLQDDLSRSVKAGMLMHETGYADEECDRALAVLGGAVLDDSPTIQTRSLAPKQWAGSLAALNMFSTWAARVKATRNAHEAWNLFQKPPQAGVKPNFQVYAEMFAKLYATGISQASSLLPGDSKELFPVYDQSLSDFERARLTPPSVKDLYHQMLREGTRPVGQCLAILVQNARSVPKALQYFHDSGLDKETISALEVLPTQSPLKPSADTLRRISLPEFNAYISLLCRIQPRANLGTGREHHAHWVGAVHHAIKLCGVRLSPMTRDGRRYKAPWHTILRTLAQRNVIVTNSEARNREIEAIESLSLFMKVFTPVRDMMGLDPSLFDSLCQVTQRVLEFDEPRGAGAASHGTERNNETGASHETKVDWVQKAHSALTRSFRQLTECSSSGRRGQVELKFSTLSHELNAAHLHKYVRVMAGLGDTAEIAHVMRWILQSWDDDTVLEDAKDPSHKQHAIMTEIMTFFRTLSKDHMAPHISGEIKSRLLQLQQERGCTWLWPSDEDVEDYMSHNFEPDRCEDRDEDEEDDEKCL
ncbi:uncharacterized protein E0L32_002698 [Thyridium curvatum]|uniref:Uncharacterized protein n=1 Tax=Thyridium curvatum TaxID=1093900 RepID=A0A507BL21_9PEZI|nr:uncharacterized protein E0L32_002698 [Thyridium curvatum]TPX18189.1 hypothetical protein E0L32_002698 [Thyridium curvatum]